MGKGKSKLDLTLDLSEKEQERLEELAEHDDRNRRISSAPSRTSRLLTAIP
jgi:hypothetical protein